MIRRDRREMPLKQGAETRTRTRPVCGKEHRPERVFFTRSGAESGKCGLVSGWKVKKLLFWNILW